MWQIAKLKISKLFGAIGEDFFPSSLQIPLLGLFLLFYVFFPSIFFFFFSEGERRKGWVSGRTSPPHPHPTLQSGFYGHSIFCRAVSSFSEELMCSVNPVRWLPPYSGGYANTSKPEHFRPIHGPRQHTFH